MKSDLTFALGLFAAVTVTAAMVNAFAPAQRSRVRRVVILFVLSALSLAFHYALDAGGIPKWASRFQLAAELAQAFTIINIVGTLSFAVALPRLGAQLPMIASDLLVGVGYLLATIGVLAGHGLDPTSVLATSAVVSAVLAISLQSTLGNILGGVALQLDDSIHEGDWIQLENGRQGRVRSIRWRHTVVETRDWATIIVPNAQLLANNITILGKRDGRSVPQRMWVWFNVDFRFPPPRVIDVVSEAMTGSPIEGVAQEPRPNVVCMDLTKERRESFATYAVRYWLTDLAADEPTNSRVRARVYTALRRAGIPLAVPATTAFVEVQDDSRLERRSKRKVDERLEALATVTLFRHLTSKELLTLAAGMSHVMYTAGEVITRQGAVAHWLYVLTKGTVEVRANVGHGSGDQRRRDADAGAGAAQSKTVATLRAPDFFGEMGLTTGEPRVADVVATTDVDCFRLGKVTFEEVLVERPEIAEELSQKLAARRVGLLEVTGGLAPGARSSREASERERILGAIKGFFGL